MLNQNVTATALTQTGQLLTLQISLIDFCEPSYVSSLHQTYETIFVTREHDASSPFTFGTRVLWNMTTGLSECMNTISQLLSNEGTDYAEAYIAYLECGEFRDFSGEAFKEVYLGDSTDAEEICSKLEAVIELQHSRHSEFADYIDWDKYLNDNYGNAVLEYRGYKFLAT